MVKRFVIVMLAVLTLGLQAFAQNVVTGKVTDESGEPLVGVGIQVKGTQAGAMTDLDGVYGLEVGPNATLVFSYIGFMTQEVAVGSRKTVNVVLAEDNMRLDEVVVVGYGTARKKDVSGAIQSVNYGKDANLANLANPNALSGLSSRVAGFTYAPTNDASGDNTSTMTIRGKNAIPADGKVGSSYQSVNQPLLVIDGVISHGSINEINTADIQSIDVLKDASAAAIYGSRAANGVIIITTKSGSNNAPTVNFNASVSLSDWTRIPKMVSDGETFLKNRFYSHKGLGEEAYKNMEWSDYSSIDAAATELLTTMEKSAWDKGIYTDWLKEISRLGVGQKYDVSVGGREKNINYYVSGDYTRQQGIRLGDDYEKYGALAKVDINITDWLTVGVKANYLQSNSWGVTARIQNATWLSPYSFTHSTLAGYEDWPNSHPDGNVASPLYGSGENDSYLWTDKTSKGHSLTGIGYAQVDFPFLKGLSYRVTFQGRRGDSMSDIFNNPELWVNTSIQDDMDNPSKFAKNSEGKSTMSQSSFWSVDNILTYSKDFQKHHFDVMAGYTREHSISEGLGVFFKEFTGLTYLGVYKMDASTIANLKPTRTRTESQAIGYLARLNYNYANKYYLTGNFRRDGYSAFAQGHKWGNFYGASAAWVLSNEDFIKDLGAFDFLKLRVSWGQNGSRSVSPYMTLSTVDAVSTTDSGAMTYSWLGNASAYGVAPQSLPARALTWATVEKFNVGLDFAIFNSRLNGTLDVYTGATKNMLMSRSAPYMTGFKTIWDNVGRVTNNGIEFTLNTVNVNGNGRESFRWESNLVFDANRNKIVSLYGKNASGVEADDVANAVAYGFDSYYAMQVGHPIGSAYDYTKLGIFQSEEEIKAYVGPDGKTPIQDAKPGDIKYADISGPEGKPDGKINSYDRGFIGSPDPLFTVNFANTLAWKGFSLYFNLRWAQGDKTHFIWFDPNAFGTTMTGGAQLAAVKPWTENNPSDLYPRYGFKNDEGYLFWNPRTFLKLKDVQLSYTVNPNLINRVGLAGLRFYVAATDLLTFTKWSGLDPENAGTIAGNASSSRYGSNGTYKTVTFGVNLSFAAKGKKAVAPVGAGIQVKEVIKEVVKEKIVEKPVEKIVEKVVYKGGLEGTYEDDLYFLIGKSELRPDETFKLGRICQILKENPEAKIAIAGYADSGTGTAKINQTLSEQRAAVVADMLKKAGIDAGRITTSAAGGDRDASATPASNRVAVCIVK